jgi:hypothetical protein
LIQNDGKQKKSVAQSAGHDDRVETCKLIGDQVVIGHAALITEVLWIRARMKRPHWHNEPQAICGGHFAPAPVAHHTSSGWLSIFLYRKTRAFNKSCIASCLRN